VSTARRGIKNAYRNTIRTVSIVLILSISFGLALVMLLSVQAVNKRTASVSQSVGTTITVTPAGSQGFNGGGNPLTTADVNKIAATANVTSVVTSVSDRLSNSSSTSNSPFGGSTSGGTTSLKSSISPGSLGRRFGGGTSSSGGAVANFSLPVTVTGSTQPLSATVLGASSVTLTSGTAISGTSSADVADVGTSLAKKNDLKVGSTFTAYKKTFTVEGIYTTNSEFTDGGFVVPLKTLQTLSGISGVTTATANVNTIDHLSTAATKIQSVLGTSVATVTTGQTDDATIISSLDSIKTIAVYSLIGALVAGAIILFLSMLMIVRERRREIGILKAFGSSNGGVVRLFTTEALTLTAMGALGGIILGVLLSNPVLQVLVNNTSSTSSTNPTRGVGFGGGRPGGVGTASPIGFGHSTLTDLHAAVGFNILIFGVLAAIVIAVVGSAIPSYIIAKVRPAEVLRGE
jgi:putative ABC transport system permease protein